MRFRSIPKRVYVVDRQPLVREWLTHALSKEPGVAICGQSAGAMIAMRDILAHKPDAVVMDMILDDSSGLDLIERAVSQRPGIAVLVLSVHEEVYYADRVLRAGAKGYISKSEPTRKIVAAIRCVLQGKIYVSPAMSQGLLGRRAGGGNGSSAELIQRLSDREMEVFEMIGRGMSTRRIAGLLHLSPKTIETYDGRIKEKLHLRDGNELLREAIRWVEGARIKGGLINCRPQNWPSWSGCEEMR